MHKQMNETPTHERNLHFALTVLLSYLQKRHSLLHTAFKDHTLMLWGICAFTRIMYTAFSVALAVRRHRQSALI